VVREAVLNRKLTSEVRLLWRGEPENKVLLPELSREEEVGAKHRRVLQNVADGDVEVAALLQGGLNRKGGFIEDLSQVKIIGRLI